MITSRPGMTRQPSTSPPQLPIDVLVAADIGPIATRIDSRLDGYARVSHRPATPVAVEPAATPESVVRT